MFAPVRAGLLAALFAFACVISIASPAIAQNDRPFQRDDLDQAAVRLEAQIKSDAGQVTKPQAQLRKEMDEAFRKNDFRLGLQLLGQLVSVAPDDASAWLRLARSVAQIRPANDRERTLLSERAATAGYIAYERSDMPAEQAEALQIIGKSYAERRVWRPALDALRLSLDLREVADIRAQYERLREEHGFRLLDYTVDADAASPRACFQFSETLPGKRTDFSPFVAVPGTDKPAVTVDEKQLCVEGLKHGERYTITLRAGLPSSVDEPLARAADYTIYVRDRKPQVRFTGRSYVLPRTGQQGIPVVSVNSKAATIDIYRVGDRNLIETVLGSDFQRALTRYDAEQLRDEKGIQVWTGELALESQLNAEVTTAFPIDQALGDLKPGVYVMTAAPKDAAPGDNFYTLATQWFIVSDLGLAAFSGNDGIHAFVNSLASTAPVGQIEVRLMSRSNEVLAVKRTDAGGQAHFEANLTRGEGGLSPALIVASTASDYAFLNLKSSAFDLSDRGVAGRKAPEGLDAFVFTERGVYRTGETVHITALLRDPSAVAAGGVPVTLVVERPDGVEYRRVTLPDQGIGGRSLSLPIASTASTGTWRVKAFTDPKRPAVGEVTFMVEDYVPDRLEFDLAAPSGKISTDAPTEVTLNGRFLYGAPAANLGLQGEVLVSAAKERPGFPGYQFGNTIEAVEAEQQPLDLPQTDEEGKASFEVTLDDLPTTERLLEARVTIRLAESGGRAVERKLTLPVVPATDMIGVKPLFSGRSLGESDNATFDVVLVDPEGKRLAKSGLRYELLKIESRYQWYRQHGYWNYEPVKSTRRIADGTIDVTEGAPARLSLPVTWGRYRLEVSSDDKDVPLTSVAFDAGFYAEAGADTPDLLEIALDKPEYRAGDTMNVAVTARSDGRVTLNVVGDRMLATVNAEVKTGLNQFKVPVGKDWGNGAYLVATLRRPLDAAARRMPGRAIGVQWFGIDRAARTLAMDMALPQTIRPNSTLRVPVKLAGLRAGEEARVVIAAVDVGILNLTNYKPPAPDDYFLGQRRLSAELRDLYGQLIDGMQGSRGAIRTGGDDGGGALEGSPPVQKPLALYSGIVQVRGDGTAEVSFDIPDFAGTARVMGVAWSRDRVGKATGDVIVRDPVVVTATLPRFLNTGDKSTLHVDVDNVEGPAGDYSLSVAAQGAGTGGKSAEKLMLRAKQRQSVSFPLEVTAAGTATVSVNLAGPNGFALTRNYALNVRPATQQIARRSVRQIATGESITISNDVFADLVPGTGSVSLSVGASTALDAAAILKALDRYPFGCSEQIASRALPLLYVNDLAASAQLALDTEADTRIRESIERLLARQGSNGGFGLWSVGGDDPWLDAYVTDFLTRARERGYAVPDVAFRLALDRLRNNIATSPEPSKDGGRELAYALYVLARNGMAPVGDLRYIADTKLKDVATPIAKAQIAAALGLLGDKSRAERVFDAALDSIAPQPKLEFGRVDYGSALRDAAALVTLASEGNAPRPTVTGALSRIEAARNLSSSTSTQENAWLVLAARAIAKDAAGVSMMLNGQQRKGALYRGMSAAALQEAPLRVGNTGEETLQAVVTVSGSPLVPEPAAERGFKIERNYFTLEGEPADISKAKQNDRYAVVLKITEQQPQFGRIIVADYLPAGFEIDNPRLVSSGETGTLSWIELAQEPAHAEFRDDRFTAAFNRKSGDPAIFTVAYVVRAVSPGTYVHPQAYVEDMYRPDRFGRTASGALQVSAAK